MTNNTQICDLEYEVLPAASSASTKILSIPLVPIILVILDQVYN